MIASSTAESTLRSGSASFSNPLPRALIGQIKKWHKLALYEQIRDFLPLVIRKIRACRIVTASMQQDHIAFIGRPQRFAHLVKHDGLRGQIEEGIFHDLLTRMAKEEVMAGPTWSARKDTCLGGWPSL